MEHVEKYEKEQVYLIIVSWRSSLYQKYVKFSKFYETLLYFNPSLSVLPYYLEGDEFSPAPATAEQGQWNVQVGFTFPYSLVLKYEVFTSTVSYEWPHSIQNKNKQENK